MCLLHLPSPFLTLTLAAVKKHGRGRKRGWDGKRIENETEKEVKREEEEASHLGLNPFSSL